MNCQEVRLLFSEYYDRELNQEIESCLEKHLTSCQECKAEYKKFKKSLKILKRLRPLEAPRNYLEEAKSHKRN